VAPPRSIPQQVLTGLSHHAAAAAVARDAVQGLARDGLLFVTFANHHYTQFALTWVHHMRRNNMTNYIVGSMDEQILYSLAKRQVYTFAMNAGESGARSVGCFKRLLSSPFSGSSQPSNESSQPFSESSQPPMDPIP
jgi:hypothetical protein